MDLAAPGPLGDDDVLMNMQDGPRELTPPPPSPKKKPVLKRRKKAAGDKTSLWDENIEMDDDEFDNMRKTYDERMKKEREAALVKKRRFDAADMVQKMINCMSPRIVDDND